MGWRKPRLTLVDRSVQPGPAPAGRRAIESPVVARPPSSLALGGGLALLSLAAAWSSRPVDGLLAVVLPVPFRCCHPVSQPRVGPLARPVSRPNHQECL